MQSALLDDSTFEATTPRLRGDALVRRFENEAVVWSPIAAEPLHLDPVAALVFELFDGETSIAELIADVQAVLGIPEGVIRSQLRRTVSLFEYGGMLAASSADDMPEVDFDVFAAPPNP